MTSIRLCAAPGRARLETRAGALVPRVIETGPASARVALVAGGALLLGGDEVRLSITVGAGCTLELEDIGGTVAYDADGLQSTWTVEATVEANALLIWHGLPFVLADGANVDRRTTITLRGHGALACLRETIVLGRTGERGGAIDLHTTVLTTGGADPQTSDVAEPLFVERLRVRGAEPVPGVLGGHRVLDSLLLLGTRAPAGSDGPGAAAQLGPTELLQPEGPASIARSLQHEAHRSLLTPVWTHWCAHALAVHAAALWATPADATDGFDNRMPAPAHALSLGSRA
ncbi:urease accessory protein UreD [Cryobacterium sp. 1639]|uniref:urease accessory protein UreD n=1 Tax=Cryobacterium inferilacus TaxID=2866629 RepID=UPI001C73DF2D|nr:urease accessory protein UreD [Cryobacterium sp. 1639]MBX0300416.1 urease accessory protein UreD [Cryobacterium sp. 1639]